ncbi:3-hydroxyisobutyrate dehydrogenase [Caldovatus sediminis]|uniref:3-hydroxyisobutyrate dehydrogenase n=1 Tax=Caldovatus sediminis TaxID=2041189 RepID=A0A8J2ZCL2_9PROT|nr:NAD(P)-dependent oxidoreductase [Caldovatus sediminis]GGG37895.1 3-hydroxyisobutyrate dehydrogenase [Caldovatus sediminis]
MSGTGAPERIGFIGTGIMGGPMAGHLLRAGHPLTVFNRSRARAQPLLDAGAAWADSPAAVAAASDIVITIVGFPADVEEIYLGPQGLIAHARPGTLLIDMTTSSPSLAVRIAREAAARGVQALDAPVSGGDVGARNATLSIMVGGEAAAFERARPVFERMGRTINHMGGPGAGQHTKMANQIVIASTVMGVAEGLAYARAAGLDGAKLLAALGPGAAGSAQLAVQGPKMLAGDYAPGFMVKHFLKDLGIALAEAERMRLDLPGLALAKRLFERVQAEPGGAERGTQALIRVYGGASAGA